ncbi:DUF6681 family protein [Limosilactobacillus gorillae]|jgi:hypothetical protein|uniref:DUF6681 family protein n=1 Tax=Limosilactobacillus gorillae TaxID=1450649 RepID=UPI000B0723E0|nr:DUF6681 family protein [Limosilactobacillus gorillae]
MFSLLDMINGSLGYFNLSVKVKNRIYVALAFFGDGYLIYVTFMLLKNQAWMRGFLYFLAVLGVTYYLYLNAVYYFLGRTSRFDFLSPWLSKLTGTTRETPEEKERQRLAKLAAQQNRAMGASNGLFTAEDVIQAEVEIDSHEQENLRKVVDQLVEQGILLADYNGLDTDEIIAQYQETGQPVAALNAGQQPPYFELIHDPLGHRLEIYIGLNQMEKRPVGHIKRVGLTDAHTAHHRFALYLANLYVTGGPHKIPGRRGSTILTDGDFGLVAQVAYQDRKEDTRMGTQERTRSNR